MSNRAEIVKMVDALERVAGLINSDTPKEIRDAILAAKHVAWGSLNECDDRNRRRKRSEA